MSLRLEMKLATRLVRVAEIDDHQREEMFGLMHRYYAGMTRCVFEADLREKEWVIQIIDAEADAIRGFSTQMLLHLEIAGRPVRALFSGDTIVDPRCWARHALAQTWGRLALSVIAREPRVDTYWFLIAKGYKTYRFLPVFFREFYPRFDAITPDWAAKLIDGLGAHKYPPAYAGGIVRAGPSGCRLRDGVAAITPGRLSDPHVRFFAERNSGHARGDELCCLAPLTRENFTPAALRVIGMPS
jgi:hypothetical protein